MRREGVVAEGPGLQLHAARGELRVVGPRDERGVDIVLGLKGDACQQAVRLIRRSAFLIG